MEHREFWMYKSGLDSELYSNGLSGFLEVAEVNRRKVGDEWIWCPCKICKTFRKYERIGDVRDHLIKHGFMPKYTCWWKHGESRENFRGNLNVKSSDLNDNFECNSDFVNDGEYPVSPEDENLDNNNFNDMFLDIDNNNIGDGDKEKLEQLFVNSEKPLYTGCDYSKLGAVLELFTLKATYRWSDTSFTALLELLYRILPKDNELPISLYQANRLMCPMELDVERIHACPNDCMLYRNEFVNAHVCVTCGESRYRRKSKTGEYDADVTKNGPPAKVLWYFPIIPRLKRLFSNEKEAKLLRWHSEVRNNDGKVRHVADSLQWKSISERYQDFGNEVRNIRFGLSSDGINPFGNMSSRHRTWPVLLCIYNLPPWLCMKRKYIMMSLLIQGPKQPGNDIDVYLAPLVDDLKTLWSPGIDVYDAYKKEYFKLRAMIFCTISDFPAYDNLSGYSTKGKKACPVCENETSSMYLSNCKKTVYMGHRRFLPRKHKFRENKEDFNGSTETGTVRKKYDAFSRVMDIKTILSKRTRTEKSSDNWRKRSIFWDLPYWRHLKVRHCLDVMHIEKNVCDSLLGLLLDLPGKNKDGLNVRKDLVEMGIRKELAPIEKGNQIFLPPACYTMSKDEKTKFCECLHDIKVPSSYSSNIKRFVSFKDNKLLGMKSHDCHVLMTHMIPIALRGSLPESTRHTITKLCLFFNNIHAKVMTTEELDKWQSSIIITICELEKYFPPSFFDIMVHLVIHIVDEIKQCGPVFLRYMYPFERYMGVLKGFVRNRNRPEGSIVTGYVAEEVTEFCTGYLKDSKSIGVPQSRHSGRLQGLGGIGKKMFTPRNDFLELAHFTVLKHMTILRPYFEEHLMLMKSTYPEKSEMWCEKQHIKEFCAWMKNKVKTMGDQSIDDPIVQKLGQGPDFRVVSFQSYDINGYTFYTSDQDGKSTLQNSGVSVIASTTQYDRNNHDRLISVAKESFYGVIKEIWELKYQTFSIPLFKCKWVSNKTGVRVDKYGFTLVDLATNGWATEPFVLASHCTQVFYVNDPSKPRLHVVLQGKRRILGVDNVVDEEEYNQFDDLPPFSIGIPPTEYPNFGATYFRSDHSEGIYVDQQNQTE